MQRSLIKEKSYSFALLIIDMHRVLLKQNELVLSKQLLRSGTSVGANVGEVLARQSRFDFISKMSIAAKEARESRLLRDSKTIGINEVQPLLTESESIINILTAIVKTAGANKLNSKPITQNLKPQ